MPFTPFHLGPGMLVKAVLQGSFSLMVFAWSQIVMDLQPLWVLLTGHGHLHGFSHTFLGCTLIAVFCALSGKYLAELGLRILVINKQQQPIRISWLVAIVSAFIGCFSHVILDAIMHADVEPFYPLSLTNPLLDTLSVTNLHKLCIYSGIVGVIGFYLIQWFAAKTNLDER